MKNTKLIANIQKRMDQCRRLAAGMTDERTAKTLRDISICDGRRQQSTAFCFGMVGIREKHGRAPHHELH